MADRWKQWALPASSYLWLPVEMQANSTFHLSLLQYIKTVKFP
jgi:hypothetical protein